MGYGLGGEVAWLKILAIGKIKAFTQRPAEVFGSSREGGLAQNRSVFLENTQKVERIEKDTKKDPE
ncbi:hypothetical protein [Streptococcus thermophilus]|uniref:hypothetical protein n=1 Tax=Streptococcus thermophilus TaxID=1308 RepID=UPI0015C23FC9|nr:hypothetical protein [Streptococcus thermophilus]CAD0142571.1 protein of unknown function [Streptococcus thermophilus]